MEYAIGILIIISFITCIYGIVDIIKQINNEK